MKYLDEKKLKRDPRVRSYKTKTGDKFYRVSFKRTIVGKATPFEKQGFRTGHEASHWADAALHQAMLRHGKETNLTVAEYYEQWFNSNVAADNWSPDTIKTYGDKFRLYILPRFGDYKLTDINKIDFQNYINEMQQVERPNGYHGYSSRTLRIIKNYFGLLLDDAVDSELIPSNRIRRTKIKDNIGVRNVDISLEKYNAAIDAAERILSPIELASFYLALFGLRHAEILGMKPKAIEQNSIHIEHTRTMAAPKGKDSTKTVASTREVPITLKMHNILMLAIQAAKTIYLENDKEFTNDSYIIVNQQARPLNYTGLNYFFDKVSAEIDFHIFPHLMRHAFATFASRVAKDPKDVANILGHTDIKMTQKYDNGTDQGKREVIDMMDRLAK